ncbi:hypothetical protein [Jannaschia sp. LMIT008]|uniref:hypothetical protein n=1 Tax=Jannaschia maritima TaxID=3032585 RepID=UPI002810B8A7|nr:hypothetical protein [Jannaschia sp. LMIT008]
MTTRFKPNVVFEPELVDHFAAGAAIVVTCKETLTRKESIHYGRWTVRLVFASGDTRQLVTQRDFNNPRVFRTLNGIASLLAAAGCTQLAIPFAKGAEATNTRGG